MKKLFKQKKGVEYLSLLVGVLIIVMPLLAYNLLVKVNAKDLTIGEYAVGVLQVNDKASKDLLFLNFVAEKSARQALYRFAQNNALPLGTSCGTSKDYKLWNTEEDASKMCTESIHENYAKYLNIEINKYLDKKVNYEFFINEETIRGIALENWQYPIFLPEKRVKKELLGFLLFDEKVGSPLFGKYIIKPSFKINFPNELNNLEKLRTSVQKMAEFCSNKEYKTAVMLENCADQFKLEYGRVKATKTRDKNVFYFDVTSDMSSLNEELKLNFKFAVKIPWTMVE